MPQFWIKILELDKLLIIESVIFQLFFILTKDSFVTDGRSKTKWASEASKIDQSALELPSLGTNIGESLIGIENNKI